MDLVEGLNGEARIVVPQVWEGLSERYFGGPSTRTATFLF